jgi:hypothetical protein
MLYEMFINKILQLKNINMFQEIAEEKATNTI